MSKYLFVFFLFVTSLTYSQSMMVDSLSGGLYRIESDSTITKLVNQNITLACTKVDPTPSGVQEPEPTNTDPCFNSPKVMGYKIQIKYTKVRDEANKIRETFSQEFPYLVPEMVYTRPDYRIMAGDYFTKRSAAADLAQVKKKYPGAFLVQWRVWCRKAK